MSRISKAFVLVAAVHLLALVSIALAEDDADELSKQLANPISTDLRGGRRAVPVLVALATPADKTSIVVAASTIVALAILGGLGASAGGAGILHGCVRVTFWGALAMGVTAAVGAVFGSVG